MNFRDPFDRFIFFLITIISLLIVYVVVDIVNECVNPTPIVHVRTIHYDGYVTDDYHCGKHRGEFIDTKTKKKINFQHGPYVFGKYKLENGDHIELTEIVTKKFDYKYTYKIKVNNKEYDSNWCSISIINIK